MRSRREESGAGSLELLLGDGTQRQVTIHRAHLEEDAGKLVHGGAEQLSGSTFSLVDYNRAGMQAFPAHSSCLLLLRADGRLCRSASLLACFLMDVVTGVVQ